MKALLYQEIQKLRQQGYQGLLLSLLLLWRLLRVGGYFLQARYYLRAANRLGRLVFVRGRPQIANDGWLQIGNRSRIWSGIAPAQLLTAPGARLQIGEGCFINGALLAANQEIQIGEGCYFGPMATVIDSDCLAHPQAGLEGGPCAPVVIEAGAWLATRSMVLKGVRIGRGAVIAVGAIVTQDVPPHCIAAGVPARVIKRLDPSTEQPAPGVPGHPMPELPPYCQPSYPTNMLQSIKALIAQERAQEKPASAAGPLWRRLWRQGLALLRGYYYLRRADRLGELVMAYGSPAVKNQGRLEVGHRVCLVSDIARSRLAVSPGAYLKIEDGCQINGAIIAATLYIELGRNCRLEPFCHLMDSDFHDLHDRQAAGAAAPIILEEEVSLGARAMVLKGVRIGRGAVVAPGAVVTKDVAPYTLVGGVPATFISSLPNPEADGLAENEC
jgi:acetyltransferase-like isoleucine patch superfamily enzyme